MDFYTKKRQCFTKIESIIRKNPAGVGLSFLIYDVSTSFGFSQKTVKEFLHILKETGKIDIVEGVISWKTDKNSKKE